MDSQGCVFIRAGIDGNVSWVPRMSRDRKTVCGFKPTGGARSAVVAAPAAAAPVQITVDTPPAAAAPRPAPRRVAAPAPRRAAPVVVRQTAKRPAPKKRVVKAAPRVVAPKPAPVARQTTRIIAGGSPCRGASAISQQYMRGAGVRCGPQTQPIVGNRAPVTAPRSSVQVTPKAIQRHYGSVASTAGVTSTTRIAPKHVVKNRINTRNVSVPKGYREVWDDDRLNPKRAEQNLAGRSDMLLVWTQTVPRRLINQTTGRDVTASVPLVYPYTSIARQERELGKVQIMQRNGQTVKRIKRHAHAAPVVRQPVYSSRSTPKAAAPKQVRRAAAPSKALAGKRFVQVGTFANAANAQRAAQNIARMGMPARIGKVRKGSQRYMTVQAGPFHGANALGSAMNRLRGVGYRDAFAR
ncbi:Sporulation related protein [Sulfitobacter noctilucae]|nr:Sporulation related protein [Sulfitobacter noctilucae]